MHLHSKENTFDTRKMYNVLTVELWYNLLLSLPVGGILIHVLTLFIAESAQKATLLSISILTTLLYSLNLNTFFLPTVAASQSKREIRYVPILIKSFKFQFVQLWTHRVYTHNWLPLSLSPLGAGLAGVEDLRAHPFFASIDWNSV